MRARRALAACGAFVMVTCDGDALSAGTAGVTAAEVESVLRAAGDEARVVRADADTARIEARSPDYAYWVDLYRCAEGRCRAVEFRVVFPEYAGPAVDLSVIDDWNAQTLFGKALLEPDGAPALEMAWPADGRDAVRAAREEWQLVIEDLDFFLLVEAEMPGDSTAQGGGGPAFAEGQAGSATLDVCNRSGSEVSVAYATAEGGTDDAGQTLFRSQGWRNVPDGACEVLWTAPFANRFYYVFAQADDGSYGGDFHFCTLESRFDIVDTQCSEDYEREGFLQIDMSQGTRMSDGFQLNLTP